MYQQTETLYHPGKDPVWKEPYIDVEEWREEPEWHLYVHGGFTGTNTRFSFYFPPKESYGGRFFHLLTPVQGNEDSSQKIKGDENGIGFAVTHGAYFVESNMGGDDPDYTMLYKASAASAEYSRVVAGRLFGEHRPYGYLYGGSGGSFKTIAAIENTDGIWDGSVPFVNGSPMSIPNMFTVRVHAMRLLRDRFPEVIDAFEPGGSGDPSHLLTKEQVEALKEATEMGFPPKAWFAHKNIGAGALPVLVYAIDRMDAEYYTDFWTKPGYLGSDPKGSAVRDHLVFSSRVEAVELPQKHYRTDDYGVDAAWQTMAARYETEPVIVLREAPANVSYLDGTKVKIISGAAAGLTLPLGRLEGNRAVIGEAFGLGDIASMMQAIQPGDEVCLDNSDYIAIQTYHRHQVPTMDYIGFNQFRDEQGEPRYPQRPILIGPMVAYSGGGAVQTGKIRGKMIVLGSLLDESAMPWQADWYRKKVTEFLGDKTDDSYRLWYSDNAMHGGDYTPDMSLHIVSYQAALNQALLDVSNWAEKGIVPPQSTEYTIEGAQVKVPEKASQRKGIQPVITLMADGGVTARINAGEAVTFEGMIEVPENAGEITWAEFDFDGTADYTDKAELTFLENKTKASVKAEHIFNKPGTYFVVLRAASNRNGDASDLYTQVKNLARVRVAVQ